MAGHHTGQILAIGAGLCAACASVFAKLAVTSDVMLEICQSVFHLMVADQQNSTESAVRYSSMQRDVRTDFCVSVKLANCVN